MHSSQIRDHQDQEWTIRHNGDLSDDLIIQPPAYGADSDGITIPCEVILELVGRHLQMEVIADLEDMRGTRLVRALQRMGAAAKGGRS